MDLVTPHHDFKLTLKNDEDNLTKTYHYSKAKKAEE
jgi:hypothetical protein